MPKKTTPIITDVIKPNETVPASSSRPIVVTNRPLLSSDPMMVETETQPETSEASEEPTINRQAAQLTPPTDEPLAETTETTDKIEPEISLPTSTPFVSPVDETVRNDSTNELNATDQRLPSEDKKLAADAARQAELEKLVADGTYNIPINAVGRKRSRTLIMAITALAAVLIVVVLVYLSQR